MTVPATPQSKWRLAREYVVTFLVSPQARRYEIALALGIYEAIRSALGHA